MSAGLTKIGPSHDSRSRSSLMRVRSEVTRRGRDIDGTDGHCQITLP